MGSGFHFDLLRVHFKFKDDGTQIEGKESVISDLQRSRLGLFHIINSKSVLEESVLSEYSPMVSELIFHTELLLENISLHVRSGFLVSEWIWFLCFSL